MELVLIGLRRASSGQIQCNWLVKSDANRWSSAMQTIGQVRCNSQSKAAQSLAG